MLKVYSKIERWANIDALKRGALVSSRYSACYLNGLRLWDLYSIGKVFYTFMPFF